MDRAGDKLKRLREKLGLTYRDVERASQQIAKRRNNDEFAIALSRLADIEHKGTVPTIYRLYTLCAVYRLDFCELLSWYGVPADAMAADSLQIALPRTHTVNLQPCSTVPVPQPSDLEFDTGRTTFLNHLIRRWGRAGLGMLSGLDLKQHRYGLIGTEDWSMYPVLQPGSLVLIDEGRRKVASHGWNSEIDRPIYFLELRDGFRCGWCAVADGKMILQAHPASQQAPEILPLVNVDVVGQVTGVAMILEGRRRRAVRSSTTATEPRDP